MLSQSETYFRKVQIHVIQCDDKVQSDVVLTCADDLKSYMEHFQIKGYGGTDFRPAFEYVNTLKAMGQLNGLKGLIYFTDGKGIYPVAAPVTIRLLCLSGRGFAKKGFRHGLCG